MGKGRRRALLPVRVGMGGAHRARSSRVIGAPGKRCEPGKRDSKNPGRPASCPWRRVPVKHFFRIDTKRLLRASWPFERSRLDEAQRVDGKEPMDGGCAVAGG